MPVGQKANKKKEIQPLGRSGVEDVSGGGEAGTEGKLVDRALDELPRLLLLLGMPCVLFHPQHCFQVEVEREVCISVWETG